MTREARKTIPKAHYREDDPKQSRRFIDAAKIAEADESQSAAERAFQRVAKPKKPRKT